MPLQTLFSHQLHFIVTGCIRVKQKAFKMTLHVPDMAVEGGWIVLFVIYGWEKKNDRNLKSVNKSCTLCGVHKIIEIPVRAWFWPVKHEEPPIKRQLLWWSEASLNLYELHKNTLLTGFDK